MLVSTIVLIVLRLFSIQYLLTGLSILAISFVEFSNISGGNKPLIIAKTLIAPGGSILISIITWLIAPWLAGIIPENRDATVQIPSLSLRDLYAFAFIFLGLYFVLASIGNTLNWLYYAFVIAMHHAQFDSERKTSLYDLSRPLITTAGGFICLLCARRWADKLAGEKKEASVPAEKPIP